MLRVRNTAPENIQCRAHNLVSAGYVAECTLLVANLDGAGAVTYSRHSSNMAR